jgi:signal transduction histidine kinase
VKTVSEATSNSRVGRGSQRYSGAGARTNRPSFGAIRVITSEVSLPASSRDHRDLEAPYARALYVAHEISQPLAAVLTNAQAALRWLTREPINVDEARQALKGVIGNSRRATYAVESIRASLDAVGPTLNSVEIKAVIASVLDLMAHDISYHGIEVETQFDNGLRPVRSGPGQLECVISNLVKNAVEAMSEVEGEPRNLRIRAESDEQDDVLVSVEDSGVGIHPRNARRIFDPFFTTKRGSIGAGLWISRSIVETHGGRLWVTRNSPKGSVFQFVIPAWKDG